MAPAPSPSSLAEVLETLVDLTVGATTIFLPLFILAVPAFVLLVLPVILLGGLLAAVAGVLALPLAPPYLLLRAARRRRAGRAAALSG